jgi:cytochrome c1
MYDITHFGLQVLIWWYKAFLEKFAVIQLVKNFLFMEPKDSSPHSQKPVIVPYPEPDAFTLHFDSLFL